jgi:hypothetical protein
MKFVPEKAQFHPPEEVKNAGKATEGEGEKVSQ